MTAAEDRPAMGAVSEAGELAASLTAAPDTPQRHAVRPRMSGRAENYLDALADALARGRVGLHQLPSAVLAFYVYGHDDGQRSRDAEIVALNRECDIWYLRANNTKAEVERILADRLDTALGADALAWFEHGGETLPDRFMVWLDGFDASDGFDGSTRGGAL